MAVKFDSILGRLRQVDNRLKSLIVGTNTLGGNVTVNATLGAEMVPALETSNWTLGTNWTATGGVMSKASGTAGNATPSGTFTVTVGKTYKIVITVSAQSYQYFVLTVGGTEMTLGVGTYTRYLTAKTTAKLIVRDQVGSGTMTITSLSCKEITLGTGDIVIDGQLSVRSQVLFENSVGMGIIGQSGVRGTPLSPLEVQADTSTLRGIRVSRPAVQTQYLEMNEQDGSLHALQAVGGKVLRFINDTAGFLWQIASVTYAQISTTGMLGYKIPRVTSIFSKTTTTTLADITGLTYTLEAGQTYRFEATLYVDADATGGSKYAIAGTATATTIIYEVVLLDNTTSANTITSRQTAMAGAVGQAGTTAGMCKIYGTIICNVAGTITVQFAQNASNGTSSVLIGSNFIVNQVF